MAYRENDKEYIQMLKKIEHENFKAKKVILK